MVRGSTVPLEEGQVQLQLCSSMHGDGGVRLHCAVVNTITGLIVLYKHSAYLHGLDQLLGRSTGREGRE